MRNIFFMLSLTLFFVAAPLFSEEPPVSTKSYTASPFTHGILSTHDGRIMDFLEMNLGLSLMYGYKPLVLEYTGTGMEPRDILEHKFEADIAFAIGLWKYIDFALDLPLNLYHGGDGFYKAKMHAGGVGDMIFYPRVGYTFKKEKVSIAFIPEVTIPTGRQVDRLMGYATATFAPTIAVSSRLGDFTLAANLFYRIMDKRELGSLTASDEVGLKIAGGYTPIVPLDIEAEINIRTVAVEFFDQPNTFFIDANLGVQYRFKDPDLMVHGGAGWGMTQGYGLPIARVFAGFTYNLPGAGEEPEKEETTPTPEPKTEPKTELPKDTDGDGMPDKKDLCPNEPETKNDFEDIDGCPDSLDMDGDGIEDAVDRCPGTAEDIDGFEDNDGCPDADNDNDGVSDEKDLCQSENETPNGFMDEDGCSDTAPAKPLERIVVTSKVVEIKEKILFATDRSDIDAKSFKMLDEIASVLIANPNIRLRIEGHTDNIGGPEKNLKLSQGRADAVRNYLIYKEVAAERLSAIGRGEEQPIKDNASEEGREANRRVEFHIVK